MMVLDSSYPGGFSTGNVEEENSASSQKLSKNTNDDNAISVNRRVEDEVKETSLEKICTKQSQVSMPLHKVRSNKKRTKDLVIESYPETDLANNLIGWDGQDDPLNPRNYSETRKWTLLGLVSGVALLSPLSSSAPAPGIPVMDMEFRNTSKILDSMVISIFVLGFALGPLFFSPMSEIYGRRTVLNCANVFLTFWMVGCALAPNIGVLIGFRLLSGIGGSGCLAVGGGVIADLFPVQQRGLANAMFSLGPLFGPVIGPIMGGFVSQRAGWRWVYWVLLMACGTLTAGNLIVNRETNAAVLIRHKTQRLRKELGRDEFQSAYDAKKDFNALEKKNVLLRGFLRPLRMLFSSAILILLATYMSFVFGLLYLIFTTITRIFVQEYGWRVEFCGLTYLGIGLGFFIGFVIVAKTNDLMVIRLTKSNRGVYEPEMRLATGILFAFFIPISFFWYGWSTEKHTHWIVPIIGLLPLGIGIMGIFSPIQTYFIDASGPYAASALAGLSFYRCIFGAFLPLAGPAMYEALGLGWGNSLLGFVALGLIPFPAVIYKYGGAIRRRWPIRLD